MSFPPSPVPNDKYLGEGELPFTAFGQFGEGQMDNRVFEQDVYWVNIRGEAFLLAEMPDDYRRNVITFLHNHIEYFYYSTVMRNVIDQAVSLLEGDPNGDVIAKQLGVATISDLSPEEWLESTPLMRRLRALT